MGSGGGGGREGRRVAAANDEAHQRAQFVAAVPGVEQRDVVLADEVEKRRARRVLGAQGVDGVDGVGGSGAVQFAGIDRETRFARDGGLQHPQPPVARGAGRTGELVRGNRGGDEDQARQAELFDGVPREDQVAVVDRVKTAAVEADVGGNAHGIAGPESAGPGSCAPKLADTAAVFRYVGPVDAITRDIISKLTTRVADLEAAMEVDRTMLKELAQEHAAATGKTFDPATFDLHRAEAFNQQREKMAIGAEAETPAPAAAAFVLDLPEVEPV